MTSTQRNPRAFLRKAINSSILVLLMQGILPCQENRLPFHLSQFTLENGLKVILSEDDTYPLISVVAGYNAGSVNEDRGKAGLAYLVENLMFQGSANVSSMQHIFHINQVGGVLNAATTEEKTIFFQTVPSNQLSLVLWLESDRMGFLEITDSKVERARTSVIEEIQQRRASDPYWESLSAFDRMMLPDTPYDHPVIGRESDLRGITVEDVKAFYSSFYTPNNAVLCVVGNFSSRNAETLIKKYFGTFPKGDKVLAAPVSDRFEKISASSTFREMLVPIPGFYVGHKLPSSQAEDFYPLSILEYILLRGKSSRLHRRLLTRERITYSFNGRIDQWKNFAIFRLFVLANNETMVEISKRAVFSEINRLRTTRLSERELLKAKNMFKAEYLNQYSSTLDKALFLVNTYLERGTLDLLPSLLDKYLEVTAGDIIGVANKYLTPENRVLLTVEVK